MGSFKQIARSRARALLGSRLVGLLELSIDRLVVRWSIDRRTGPTSGTLVIATTGDGNIGDQALLEACLENVPGPATVIQSSPDSFTIPEGVDAELVVLDGFHLRRGPTHYRGLKAFGVLAREHQNVLAIGADIMDGGYSSRLSSVTWNSLRAVAPRRSARVISMSWSGAKAPLVQAVARRAVRSGVKAYARDPESHRRLTRSGIPAESVADIVFAHSAAERGSVSPRQDLVVVNISGLLARNENYSAQMRILVAGLTEAGHRVKVLPHVVRPGNDDIALSRRVIDGLEPARIEFVDRLGTPTEISDLAAQARVVITGRMHLSILAMSRGVPAFVVGTQGKVEGLLELVGHSDRYIDPDSEFGFSTLTATLALMQEPELKSSENEQLELRATQLGELARQNFDGLIA